MPEDDFVPPSGVIPTDSPRPVAAQERIAVIDILRGFTILGILLVNMPLYAWPNWGPMRAIRANLPGSHLDEAASWLLWLFAEDKFYPLLSFLFGLGFSIQISRAPAEDFLPVYRRRLLALLLIGLLHGLLIWSGDILVTYALVGFFLLPFRSCGSKTILFSAILCVLLPIALFPLQTDLHRRLFSHVLDPGVDYKLLWNESLRTYARGSFGQITADRARAVTWNLSFPISLLQILGFFLLGLYAGRRQFFLNLQAHLSILRKALCWALLPAIVGMWVRAGAVQLPHAFGIRFGAFAEGVLETAGNLAVSFTYAGILILLAHRPRWGPLLAPLANVGRMALTNYLLQSVVCTTLFFSYGFGLYGTVHPAAGLALSIAIYALQVPLSVWWLAHFRFGPIEWVWRSLTYGKLQPIQ